MTDLTELKAYRARLDERRDHLEDCGADTSRLDAEIEHLDGAIRDAELEIAHNADT